MYFLWVALLAATCTLGQPARPKVYVQVYDQGFSWGAICVDSNSHVFSYNSTRGLWRFNGQAWEDWTFGFSRSAYQRATIRQLVATKTHIWAAGSGYFLQVSPSYNSNFYGAVHRINPANSIGRRYYAGRPILGQLVRQGPPTRNNLGICVDSTGRAWVASGYYDSTRYYNDYLAYGYDRYHYAPGAIGRQTHTSGFDGTDNFTFIENGMPEPDIVRGVGINYRTDSWSVGKRRTLRCIVQAGQEIWAGCDGYQTAAGVFTAGILRYSLEGAYLGKFDATNTPIPWGTDNTSPGPWALHTDSQGKVWVHTQGNVGLSVYENGVWKHIGKPGGTSSAIFQANAIASNKRGQVFFGTNQGLLVYRGVGQVASDTSYWLYTTADGLPTNFIRGIAVDEKNNATWLATGAGNVRMLSGDLVVYNLKSSYTNHTITDDDRLREPIAFYNSTDDEATRSKDTLYIAADGSRATVFKLNGSIAARIKFRIAEDANGTNMDEFGSFLLRYRVPGEDSIRVQYTHPKFIDDLYTVSTQFNGRAVHLELVDTTETPEKVFMRIPVKLLLPPVMLVHGLWADASSWNSMIPYLTQGNGLYRYKPEHLFAPSYPNDRSFESNQWFIGPFIDSLLNQCRLSRFSAGKVDVIGHSMGGILSRLYLQNSVYKNNIHKLITLNTPHSGSPLANMVDAASDITKTLLDYAGKNPNNGALGDLKLGGTAIVNLLNGDNLNKNQVPSAAINTADELSLFIELLDQAATVEKFVLKPTDFKPTIGNLASQAVKALRLLYTALRYDLLKTTPCTNSTKLNDCLTKIFNGPSDFIVSVPSQTGGLTQGSYFFNQVHHLNVHSMPQVQSQVLSLLRSKASSNAFAQNGFNPQKIIWQPGVGSVHQNSIGSIAIVNPVRGAAYQPGDSLKVTIRGSNLRSAMIMYEDGSEINSFGLFTPDSVFALKVPADAFTKMRFTVFGFATDGGVAMDSSHILINRISPMVLDSVRVITSQEPMMVQVGDSTTLEMEAYYGTVKRTLYNVPGVTYAFENGGLATAAFPGVLKGVAAGSDMLMVSFGGKTDSVLVKVVPKINTAETPPNLPVRWLHIDGWWKNGKAWLQWSTAQEQNNARFDIERSMDGGAFVTIGTVKGAGQSTSPMHYSFEDGDLSRVGTYLYRLRQVDFDGRTSLSPVVTLSLKANGATVMLRPNPASRSLVVSGTGLPGGRGLVRLLNSSGKTVLEQVLPALNGSFTINLPTVPSGIFYLQVFSGTQQLLHTGKVMIQQ